MPSHVDYFEIPTVCFYAARDAEAKIRPMMPGIKVPTGCGVTLKEVCNAVVQQIANDEAERLGGDRQDEIRQFRLTWYRSQRWIDNLNEPVRPSMAKHILVAVQQELVASAQQEILYQQAEAVGLHSGLSHIASGAPGRNVFVIHGRDEAALSRLLAFTEHLGFAPQSLSRLPLQGGETIIESLERLLPEADLVLALFTPDDEGRLKGGSEPLKPRVRQNVLIEAGFALIQRRSDSIIIALGETEIPSDLEGIRRICAPAWNFHVEQELRDVLKLAG